MTIFKKLSEQLLFTEFSSIPLKKKEKINIIKIEPKNPKFIYPSAINWQETLVNDDDEFSEAIKAPLPIGFCGQIDLGTKNNNTPRNCFPKLNPCSLTNAIQTVIDE